MNYYLKKNRATLITEQNEENLKLVELFLQWIDAFKNVLCEGVNEYKVIRKLLPCDVGEINYEVLQLGYEDWLKRPVKKGVTYLTNRK